MPRINLLFLAFVLPLLISSCGSGFGLKKGSSARNPIVLDTMSFTIAATPQDTPPLRIEEPVTWDIHHLELDLSFDWEKEAVKGKANLTLSPLIKPRTILDLDARGFRVESITLAGSPLSFVNDQSQVHVTFPAAVSLSDTVKITVNYTAFPTKLDKGSGSAITSAQGLYFIHPNDKSGQYRKQIWSQGETEYNSGWFPTIDRPSEKFTQEVFLTVDSTLHTISNGKLIYSTLNDDGTRTDYWKQDLPHSNYLVMIAIGNFSVVKDSWRDKDVWYYVDQEYVPYAQAIFGNTPEMLEFYSNILGFDYPWDKYHQVIVKDFVSGAMENTSAVIHGSFVQQTPRQMLDGTHEDVIAHELFHHWFGDVVTSKTWSHITMNEGFATYGEYLWKEHKYGVDDAKYHLQKDLVAYLSEASQTPKQLVRTHYHNPDDVFDRHSYQKGGRVVHLLRQEVGDSLFFASLRYYLEWRKFDVVETDHLRMAFEEVTGRDLGWFFDQWYYDIGHPIVKANYSVDSAYTKISLSIDQIQEDYPVFRFHVPLRITFDEGHKDTVLWVDSAHKAFSFPLDKPVYSIELDPEGDMLWELEETKRDFFWYNQLTLGRAFVSRNRAIAHYGEEDYIVNIDEDLISEMIRSEEFWYTRTQLIPLFVATSLDTTFLVDRLTEIAEQDKDSRVRRTALEQLNMVDFHQRNVMEPFISALQDSSLAVNRVALTALASRDACAALETGDFSAIDRSAIYLVSHLHGKCDKESSLRFFLEAQEKYDDVDLFLINNDFGKYAELRQDESVYDMLVTSIGGMAIETGAIWEQVFAIRSLELAQYFYKEQLALAEEIENPTPLEIEHLATLRNKSANLAAFISEAYNTFEDHGGVIDP